MIFIQDGIFLIWVMVQIKLTLPWIIKSFMRVCFPILAPGLLPFCLLVNFCQPALTPFSDLMCNHSPWLWHQIDWLCLHTLVFPQPWRLLPQAPAPSPCHSISDCISEGSPDYIFKTATTHPTLTLSYLSDFLFFPPLSSHHWLEHNISSFLCLLYAPYS